MALEAELNDIQFQDVPIGSLLANQLTIHLQMGRTIAQVKDIPLLIVKLIKYIFFYAPSVGLSTSAKLAKGMPLLTFLSHRRHYRVQIEYVIRAYSGANIGAIIFDERVTELAPNVLSILPGKGQANTWRAWFKQWCTIIIPTYRNLRSSKIAFSFAEILQYLNLLTIQTQKVAHYKKTLRTIAPAWVLTEYDKHTYSVPLIAAARSLGIPAYSLLHGSITFLQGYIPPVADKVLVWGGMQKEYLIAHGCPTEKLEVAGAPHLSDQITEKAFEDKAFWVTFATNPHRDNNIMFDLCQYFISAIASLQPEFPNLRGMIRVHPSEKLAEYQSALSISGDLIIIDDGSEFEFQESILRSDLVVTYNSAYGLDALLQNRGLIQLAKEPTNDFFTFLVDKLDIASAQNSKELSDEIRRYVQESDSADFMEHRNKQREALCLYYQEEAANNILNFINTEQEQKRVLLH